MWNDVAVGYNNCKEKIMPEDWSGRITPEFVSSLEDNEIFVFGCRNSGRHWDGASAFALKHFGAVFGQRERRQGRSYAIPTIGGTIGLKSGNRSFVLHNMPQNIPNCISLSRL